MNKIYQKSLFVVKNAGECCFAALNKVIPESCSRESLLCETTKRPGLPNPAGRQTLSNDEGGSCVIPECCSRESRPYKTTKRLRSPNPASLQTLSNDGKCLKRKLSAGFTLIELLVVVLIIGILAAIALPQYQVAVARARVARALPVLRALVQAKTRYYLANGEHTPDIDMLDVQIPYETKVERGEGQSWIYNGTPVGHLNVSAGSEGVFWEGPSVAIDTSSSRQICYADPSDERRGTKICASFGPPAGRDSGAGTPIYNVVF